MSGCQLDPAALSPAARAVLGVPETAQANELLYSLVNFVPVTKPLLDVLDVREIVEIGCELGGNTTFLAHYTEARRAQLTVVDVAPRLDAALGDLAHVEVVEARSVDYLARQTRAADAYFVDGEHTYATVAAELRAIDGLVDAERPLVVFVHDTSWPWGIRDGYAALVAGMPVADAEREPMLGLTDDGFVDDGLPVAGLARVAPRAGGPKNGLRPAVDDFLAANAAWTGMHVQGCFGLSVLWQPASLTDVQRDAFQALRDANERLAPFIATLEVGRLHALIELTRARREANHLRARREQRKRRPLTRVGRALRRLGRGAR